MTMVCDETRKEKRQQVEGLGNCGIRLVDDLHDRAKTFWKISGDLVLNMRVGV